MIDITEATEAAAITFYRTKVKHEKSKDWGELDPVTKMEIKDYIASAIWAASHAIERAVREQINQQLLTIADDYKNFGIVGAYHHAAKIALNGSK